jgi:hypothetical protein
MYTITPQTDLYLLKCPIESDNLNQITFNNTNEQYSYFNSLPKLEVDNFTYQRKDSVIRYPIHIDEILTYNYVMYKNEAYTDKWFYGFITNMEYVNDNMTYITIKTDVIQTWQFNMIWKKSFVEREHVNDDTIGKHTLPENIETGEFKVNSVNVDSNLDSASDIHYYLATTLDLEGVGTKNPLEVAGGGVYNGVYSGSTYWRFTRDNYGSIKNILQWVANCGQLDGIVGLFLCPSFLDTSGSNKVAESNSPISYNINISKSYGLDGYVPKNNKLYTYPYSYLSVTNGGGDAHLYRYEFFSTSNCQFNVKGLLAPGGSIRLTPKNYNGISENNQEVLGLGKFPICNYNVDMYTNWLTQNSVNIAGHNWSVDEISGLQSLSGVLDIGKSSLMGDLFGASKESINTFASTTSALIQKKQHELITNAVRGDLNNGDVTTASNNNNYKFYHMSVRKEYAQIIDNYFSFYGYSINDVKIPNITGRKNWNYVKTIGANIEGDIPENDMNEIKSLFNRGITLWHNPSTFLDYSQSNNIL